MFKMAFKFLPIEVEGEKKKHYNVCVYPPSHKGRLLMLFPMECSLQSGGHHLSGLIIISLD